MKNPSIQEDDLVTVYIIIYDNKQSHARIQAYSHSKTLAKSYLEFHNCKYMYLKKITRTAKDISGILDEAWNDEIQLYNMQLRSEHPKPGKENTHLIVPLTKTEINFIIEESNSYLASRIDYSFIQEFMYYLKDKYYRAFEKIYLTDIINCVLHNRESQRLTTLMTNELMILVRSFPDSFG